MTLITSVLNLTDDKCPSCKWEMNFLYVIYDRNVTSFIKQY